MLSFAEYLQEATDDLHAAFKKSKMHTVGPIPEGEAKPDIRAGVFNGAHGWLHPDGTYYHIKQPKKVNDMTEVHHGDVSGKVTQHLQKVSGEPTRHLLHRGVARLSAHGKQLAITTSTPLTDAQQMAIAHSMKGYNNITHTYDPEKGRGTFRDANREAHPGQMFVAKARDALNIGRKPR